MMKRGNSIQPIPQEEPVSVYKGNYGSPGVNEERPQAKTSKVIARLIETKFLGEDLAYLDAKTVARKMLQEAMRLSGAPGFEPTQGQIISFIQLNDLDRDGKITLQDLEEKVSQFHGTDAIYNSNGAASAKSAKSPGPPQAEKILALRSATEKLGDKAVEVLLAECRKCYDRYDKDGVESIEYDGLLPLLSDVYAVFGVSFKPNSQEARRYVDIIDSDRDGLISWGDFELFVLKVLANMETSRASG